MNLKKTDRKLLEAGLHPGIYLRQMLEERGWSQVDLTFVLGASSKSVNQIINGKQGVSPSMSQSLGAAFEVPPDYFAELQNQHELNNIDPPDQSISIRAKLQKKYPIREMIKRGWLEDGSINSLSLQIAKFFSVDDISEIPYMAHAAKKTNYEKDNIPPAQLAWLFRVKSIACSFSSPKYSKNYLTSSLDDLKKLLISPEEVRHVPKILMECGVKFVVVEKVPGSNIDGVCFWIGDQPVVGMTTRYDRIDNFWFVLRHELEHVLQEHGKSGKDMLDADLEGEKAGVGSGIPEEEKIANSAAAEFCVPQKKIESFIKRKSPFFYEKDIIGFSRVNKIHPGLAVGQIQRRLDRYNYLKQHQVRIRHFLLPSSIADGWGQNFDI